MLYASSNLYPTLEHFNLYVHAVYMYLKHLSFLGHSLFQSDDLHCFHPCISLFGTCVKSSIFLHTVEYRDISPPPSTPTKKKWPVFNRAYRHNSECSCVLFFKFLLEYQFFTEMLTSTKIHSFNDGPFYFGGGGGGVSRSTLQYMAKVWY